MQPSYVLEVTRVVSETADARSVSFAVPEALRSAFAYQPGQFLTVAVPSDETGFAARSYSLSSSPYDGGPLTVTVKRTPHGYASNWIFDHLEVGTTIRVLAPAGSFTPRDPHQDLLLVAGGSGITPMMSIIRSALVRGSQSMVLFYANRDAQSVIFASELARLAAEHPTRFRVVHWLEDEQGLPTARALAALAAPLAGHEAFICGPSPLMDLTIEVLRRLGFPRERLRREVFASIQDDPFTRGDEPVECVVSGRRRASRVTVEMDGVTHEHDDWTPTTTLLDHLQSKGLPVPSSCRRGECSTCEFTLLAGEVAMVSNQVLDEDDLDQGIRLACQSVPLSDVVRARFD